jgi:hypothetical protein
MDLLACAQCACRFYLPGVWNSGRRCCPQCGGDLHLAVHDMASIPLDARWLDPRARPIDPEQVAVVKLSFKRGHAGRAGKRIVKELDNYFATRTNGRSVEVTVNRGAPADAPLRVAAVLDGVDASWEDHFYLPGEDAESRPEDRGRMHLPRRAHLHLAPSRGRQSEGHA